MESCHGYCGVILGMRNSCWSRTGALFPLCYQAINPNLIWKLIAVETNYEQQDPKPLITGEVNNVRQHSRRGDVGWRKGLGTGGLSSPRNSLSKTRQANTSEGPVGNPTLGLKASDSGEGAGQAPSLGYEDATNWGRDKKPGWKEAFRSTVNPQRGCGGEVGKGEAEGGWSGPHR